MPFCSRTGYAPSTPGDLYGLNCEMAALIVVLLTILLIVCSLRSVLCSVIKAAGDMCG